MVSFIFHKKKPKLWVKKMGTPIAYDSAGVLNRVKIYFFKN